MSFDLVAYLVARKQHTNDLLKAANAREAALTDEERAARTAQINDLVTQEPSPEEFTTEE